jgi:hypothetical protein
MLWCVDLLVCRSADVWIVGCVDVFTCWCVSVSKRWVEMYCIGLLVSVNMATVVWRKCVLIVSGWWVRVSWSGWRGGAKAGWKLYRHWARQSWQGVWANRNLLKCVCRTNEFSLEERTAYTTIPYGRYHLWLPDGTYLFLIHTTGRPTHLEFVEVSQGTVHDFFIADWGIGIQLHKPFDKNLGLRRDFD